MSVDSGLDGPQSLSERGGEEKIFLPLPGIEPRLPQILDVYLTTKIGMLLHC